MFAEEELRFEVPEISEALGFRREQYHPDELLSDPEFPLNPPEPNPQDKYSEWDRPDLRRFTDKLGAAWEEKLEELYDMKIVRNGPVDLQVTSGRFKGSPVQAKSACVINSRGQKNDDSWKSKPGLVYVKRPEMESLADFSFGNNSGLNEEDYSEPALLHASVHYPRENMPELPDEIQTADIDDPDTGEYAFTTAYIGEIIVPIQPLYRDNTSEFNAGSRAAWPLNWDNAFGEDKDEENIMKYWEDYQD